MTDLVDRYLACWNATDAAERDRLVAATFSEDVRYVDPLADARGVHELAATIAGAQQQFPRFVFQRVGELDQHHDVARFRWGLGPAGAEPVVLGADVVRLSDDGRVASVLGFLDQVPA